MFPYVERKRRVDEYGETLDVAAWLRKGRALEADAESEEVKELKRKKAEAEAKVCSHHGILNSKLTYFGQKVAPDPPSKFVTQTVELNVACKVLFVDLEGLNDGRAVKSIVPQVNPRKMVSAIPMMETLHL
jgi:cleavage and polyadenylation specificity factor subunit 2